MRRFREQAGAITWRGRSGSKDIKRYMDKFLTGEARRTNITRSCKDLTKEQLDKLCGVNAGKNPERHHKGATEESRAQYKAKVQPRINLAATALQDREEASNEDPDVEMSTRELTQEERGAGLEGGYEADSNNDVHESEAEDASGSDDEDLTLYEVPSTAEEGWELQTLLQPTWTHYAHLTGHEWGLIPLCCYMDEYDVIQNALKQWWKDQGWPGSAPKLIGIQERNFEVVVWNQEWDEVCFGPRLDGLDL